MARTLSLPPRNTGGFDIAMVLLRLAMDPDATTKRLGELNKALITEREIREENSTSLTEIRKNSNLMKGREEAAEKAEGDISNREVKLSKDREKFNQEKTDWKAVAAQANQDLTDREDRTHAREDNVTARENEANVLMRDAIKIRDDGAAMKTEYGERMDAVRKAAA